MPLEVRNGSAQWADPYHIMLAIDARMDSESEWSRSHITRNDPSDEFAQVFEDAIADPPAYGEVAEYVEPEPAPAPGDIPIVPAPPPGGDPPTVIPPAPLDWDEEANRFVAAIFTVRGQSVRSSMNVWAAAVALTPEADRDQFDDVCATMVPALNDWEGLVFAERDRLKALEGATLADANWPPLPAGAPQFIEWCAEP